LDRNGFKKSEFGFDTNKFHFCPFQSIFYFYLFHACFSPDRNFVPFIFTLPNQVYSFFNINYCNSNFLFRYKTTLAETRQTKDVRDKIAVYEDFYKFLSEKTGLNLEELLDLYNLLTAQVN